MTVQQIHHLLSKHCFNSKWQFLDQKKTKKRKVELPGLELTAGEVFRSCQSWTLYHCATKLRQFLQLKFLNKNVSTGKTVVYTIVTVFFALVLLLSFSLSQHCCDIRYFTNSLYFWAPEMMKHWIIQGHQNRWSNCFIRDLLKGKFSEIGWIKRKIDFCFTWKKLVLTPLD